MNLQTLRWPAVLAAMAVTLAALFGVGFLLKSQTVEEPLKALYTSSPVVESYSLDRQGDKYNIKLTLKDVPDLEPAYQDLSDATGKLLKDTPYTITVADHRDATLEQAYRQVNLYVQEALATGQFSAMADKVTATAAKAGLTASMEVNSDRVFVQMHDKGAYLYSVSERNVGQNQPRTEGGTGL